MQIAAAPRALVASLAALLVVAAAGATDTPRLDAASVAPAGGLRVVVVLRPLDFEEIERFEGRYRKQFEAAAGSKVAGNQVQRNASGQRLVAGGAVFLFASMGMGLIGSVAEANAEETRIESVASPVVARAGELRAEQALDRRLGESLIAALRDRGLVAGDAAAEVEVIKGFDADREVTVRAHAEARAGADPRPMLIVALEHGLPRSLFAVQGMAHLWLWSPTALSYPDPDAAGEAGSTSARRPDYATHHADGTPRRFRSADPNTGREPLQARRAYYLGPQALLAVAPVPVEDLQRPPADKVARDKAAIEAEFAERIEAQRDRDLRRQLRVGRTTALGAAERWTPLELTEHLRDAWLAAPGDSYARLVAPAQDDLARRVAEAVAVPD